MSWREDIRRILALRCEEASLISSKELDEPLGMAERLAVRGHRLVCRSCRRFRRQITFLRAAVRRSPEIEDETTTSDGGDGLPPEARARIERALAEADGENRADQSDSPSR
jgi:hypothetical protein